MDHNDPEITDVVVIDGAAHSLKVPRVTTRNTHGTGCTLSSAIGQGQTDLTRALAAGAEWELSYAPQTGHGPVHHMAMRA
ncbi:hydroxymethylpyrimidine/phosphomethylpyrimidine kinase [Nesterenkonia lacusekhoensis]|uniref:Hydroxymethylpyrimidine/phosphomethylpyrimidine kinase n=1 Tax=Nesterenkonia lacusekhoensis TaxID=150832 RepID=A0ABS4T4V6_9MICC|nr:hydroxymethylpyrimidine/phosphomethylpyrimidine kinase [Nesterenkonia lacusekhoensis]